MIKYENTDLSLGEMGLDVERLFPRSSQAHVEQMLKTFIDEVRSGKREASVVSSDSLSLTGKEAWRQLRKKLEGVGISPTRLPRIGLSFGQRLKELSRKRALAEICGSAFMTWMS